MALRLVFRPLPIWLDPVTPDPSWHPFKTGWHETMDLLFREVAMLQTRQDSDDVILQVQTTEYWLRKDGGIRAEAKVTGDGVVVSFESRYGPQRYATDAFKGYASWKLAGWQANVRAVALALEALRKVDRYGVSRRGEQYTGFNALPPGSIPLSAAKKMTYEEAVDLLSSYAPDLPITVGGRPFFQAHYRRAVKASHPDKGGTEAEFALVQQAYEVLSA